MFSLKRSKTLNVDQFVKNLGAKVSNAMMATGQALRGQALELVPRDTEALADSAVCRKEGDGFNSEIIVGFGRYGDIRTEYSRKEGRVVTREPSKYAEYVHENMVAIHDVGQANFLGQPAVDIEFLSFILRAYLHG